MNAHDILLRLVHATMEHDRARDRYMRLDFRRYSDKVQRFEIMEQVKVANEELREATKLAREYAGISALNGNKPVSIHILAGGEE